MHGIIINLLILICNFLDPMSFSSFGQIGGSGFEAFAFCTHGKLDMKLLHTHIRPRTVQRTYAGNVLGLPHYFDHWSNNMIPCPRTLLSAWYNFRNLIGFHLLETTNLRILVHFKMLCKPSHYASMLPNLNLTFF